jgi:thioredoxin-like negative regulator of GroEL
VLAAVLAILAVASVQAGQDRNVSPDQWLHHVAETYRTQGTKAALELLARDDIDVQRRTAKQVATKHGISTGQSAAPDPRSPAWTIPLLRAAGAVHMEAALELYAGARRNIAAIIDRIEIGEMLLDEAGRLDSTPSDARRWEWTIGQQALRDGHFNVARSILVRACDRYEGDTALLIACGTVYETLSSVTADVTASAPAAAVLGPFSNALSVHRVAKSDNLKRARAALERASQLDPASVEAVLRLAKVRLDQDDPDDAAKLLERLLPIRTDERATYLSRLFLGRVREKQKRFDDATALFEEAVKVIPAQSGRLALANRLHAAGRNEEARALADAAITERDVADPWWGYRVGRYWLVDAMLDMLRRETRGLAGSGQ